LDVAGAVNSTNQYNIGNNRVLGIGNQSTFVGIGAGNLSTGVQNTALGFNALLNSTTGTGNTATGTNALFSNIAGHGNTAMGVGALQSNNANNNTAVGTLALFVNSTGIGNTATGYEALRSNSGGTNNTAFGSFALRNNTANENTAIGTAALNANTGGSRNTAIGVSAMVQNNGFDNTAAGYLAMGGSVASFTGSGNTAIGRSALQSITSGSGNTANGRDSLLTNASGHSNTATGLSALRNNTEGFGNTAVGLGALDNNTVGDENTAIGYLADVGGVGLTNATAIGAGAVVNDSNKIRLGNTAVTVIEAQVGLTVVSDKRKKENFQALNGEEVLQKLRTLTIPSWNFIGHDPQKFRHYGPMAQDFFAAFGHDGVGTIGTETTINSGDMAGILMIAVQALEKRTTDVTLKDAKIAALEKETAELRETVTRFKAWQEQQTAEMKQREAYVKTVAARIKALEQTLTFPTPPQAISHNNDTQAAINQ
jgi:hypothetical protein